MGNRAPVAPAVPAKGPTPKMIKFRDGLEMGLLPTQAARAAGYVNPTTEASRLMKDPWVAGEVERIREENRQANQMTREKVTERLIKAIDMAELMSDPMGMVRGLQEINKMNGYYAPEKKEVTIQGKQRRLQTQFESMTDTELLEKLGEEIIDGEFYEVSDGADLP